MSRRLRKPAMLALFAAAMPLPAGAETAATDYAADARELAGLIRANYAYLDELPGGEVPSSPQLDAERDAVHDADSLLAYAEDMIAALADHHALTGRSCPAMPTSGWCDRAGITSSMR